MYNLPYAYTYAPPDMRRITLVHMHILVQVYILIQDFRWCWDFRRCWDFRWCWDSHATPPNPIPHTSDISGPSHLPPYRSKISPAHHLRTLLSKSRFQHTVELFKILSLILTQSLLEDIAANTNAYAAAEAREQQLVGGRKWKEVSALEPGVWLGIVLYMGVHSSPAVKDCWRHDGLNPTHPICEYMGQTQFQAIKRYFHISSPDLPKIEPKGRRLWHSKVDVILEQLWQSSQQYCMPPTHISLDECMMRATGRSSNTYKMPSKPIEQGFQFADHGYIWDFHPTSNQACSDPVPSTDGWTATGEVVYYLLRKLPGTSTG